MVVRNEVFILYNSVIFRVDQFCYQAAEQQNIDPKLAQKKGKKRRAPAPPNPFTGEPEDVEELNPFDTDDAADHEEVN